MACQWDTKRKLFSLADVCTPLSSVLVNSVTEGGHKPSASFHTCLPVCLYVCLWTGYLKKLWTDSDEIGWSGWVCDKEELVRFWWRFESGSGYESFLIFFFKWFVTSWVGDKNKRIIFWFRKADPSYQWDTKCKLFSLAEVCILPCAVLCSLFGYTCDRAPPWVLDMRGGNVMMLHVIVYRIWSSWWRTLSCIHPLVWHCRQHHCESESR